MKIYASVASSYLCSDTPQYLHPSAMYVMWYILEFFLLRTSTGAQSTTNILQKETT